MQATVREFVADLEAEDARAAQQKIAGTTPEAARTQEEIRRAQLPEDLVDPEDFTETAAMYAARQPPINPNLPLTEADIGAAMAEIDRGTYTRQEKRRRMLHLTRGCRPHKLTSTQPWQRLTATLPPSVV